MYPRGLCFASVYATMFRARLRTQPTVTAHNRPVVIILRVFISEKEHFIVNKLHTDTHICIEKGRRDGDGEAPGEKEKYKLHIILHGQREDCIFYWPVIAISTAFSSHNGDITLGSKEEK